MLSGPPPVPSSSVVRNWLLMKGYVMAKTNSQGGTTRDGVSYRVGISAHIGFGHHSPNMCFTHMLLTWFRSFTFSINLVSVQLYPLASIPPIPHPWMGANLETCSFQTAVNPVSLDTSTCLKKNTANTAVNCWYHQVGGREWAILRIQRVQAYHDWKHDVVGKHCFLDTFLTDSVVLFHTFLKLYLSMI